MLTGLVSPSLKDILHKGNNRLKISFAHGFSFLDKNKMVCSGVSRYVLESSCFHLLPTSSTNGIIRGDFSYCIEDVKLLISMRSVEFENLPRECQRMLSSSEIGWIRFQFPIQSCNLECCKYNNQSLQLPSSVKYEENRVYDLTAVLSQLDTAQFPEIERRYPRRRFRFLRKYFYKYKIRRR